jgi:asparagine synthase (glutamine-hydrolysing)
VCGLAGIIRPREPGAAAGRLGRMLAALAPRGPDGRGVHLEPAAALGHLRLAVLDAAGGAQPLVDPSGRYVLIYNGEIYNHLALRRELDYPFRTRSDGETLLAALLAWGPRCLDRLDGMFAFFLWDRARRRGLAARDALGVKPLVYSHQDGELVFASELKALLAQAPRPRLREAAVLEYLLAPGLSGVREPLCEGVEYLPAGAALEIDAGGALRCFSWFRYELPRDPGAFLPDSEATVDALRGALVSAARSALLADAPVGAFLSGGLDSTALVSLAAEAQGRTTALSIALEDQGRYDYARSRIVVADDTPFIEEAARRLQIEHRPVPAPRAELLVDLERVARIDDRLPAWEQELSQHRLARGARDAGLKAVLVGDAADETHYGYFFLLEGAVTAAPAGLLSLFGAELRLGCLRPELRAARPDLRLAEAYEAMAAAAGHSWRDPLSRKLATTHLVVQLWLGRLLHNGDVHTMACSVEARVPFAARPLLEVARRVHPDFGFRDGREKHALREAARPFVPDAVYRRRKSALPKDQLLGPAYQRALLPLLDGEAGLLSPWLDLGALRALCDRPHLAEDERALLFNVLGLVYWQRAYL